MSDHRFGDRSVKMKDRKVKTVYANLKTEPIIFWDFGGVKLRSKYKDDHQHLD